MNIIKNSIILGLFSITLASYGQEIQDQRRMNMVIEGDPRIEKLVKTYDTLKQENNKVSVYRVQVFSGERENANKALKYFEKNHFQHYSSIIYDQPNFKVKVGAFRTKEEADKFIKALDKEYNSAFSLIEVIDYKEFIKKRTPSSSVNESDEYGE